MKQEQNLILFNLSVYFPELMELAKGLNINWDRIDALFSDKIEDRLNQANGSSITVEASLYDIIMSVRKGDQVAVGMLDFLRKMVQELSARLTIEEKKLLKNNIQGILVNFDRKYLNFAGELAVLNNILKSKAYKLKGIEAKLPNGKGLDFKLESTKNCAITYVEVMNIHLDKDKVSANEDAINKFLTGRINEKIEGKKKGLEKDIEFFIVPVLWGGWEDIKIYSEYFKKYPSPVQYAIEPVAHVRFTDGIRYFDHRFGRVSGLFNNFNTLT